MHKNARLTPKGRQEMVGAVEPRRPHAQPSKRCAARAHRQIAICSSSRRYAQRDLLIARKSWTSSGFNERRCALPRILA